MIVRIYEVLTELAGARPGLVYNRFRIHARDFTEAVKKAKVSKNMGHGEFVQAIHLIAEASE